MASVAFNSARSIVETFDNSDRYDRWLINRAMSEAGFQSLGQGAYGSTWTADTMDPRRIIKVAIRDHAWWSYLNDCDVALFSDYAPKVYAKDNIDGCMIVEMERLRPLDGYTKQSIFTRHYTRPGIAALLAGFDENFAVWSDALKDWGVERGLGLDFHGGNIMLRGDTPVWTDPFAG